jgi:hypothetical protein
VLLQKIHQKSRLDNRQEMKAVTFGMRHQKNTTNQTKTLTTLTTTNQGLSRKLPDTLDRAELFIIKMPEKAILQLLQYVSPDADFETP